MDNTPLWTQHVYASIMARLPEFAAIVTADAAARYRAQAPPTGAVDAGTATDAPSPAGAGTGAKDDAAGADDSTQELIAAGESPECPECGGMNLYYSEGCKTCESCGWSEC